MYTSREAGLGLAPAVALSLVSLGRNILTQWRQPNEVEVVAAEADKGNVVAWWRLKAIAGSKLKTGPYSPADGKPPIVLVGLYPEERAALIQAAGPEAAEMGGAIASTAALVAVQLRYYATGSTPAAYTYGPGAHSVGTLLDQAADTLLHPAAGAAPADVATVLAGFPVGKVLLVGAAGWILWEIFRR